jgi:anaphase-promoting complex subunit 6
MQNIQLSNLSLAKEYLKCAWDLCQTDPLLLNELGVVYYHDDCLDEAAHAFTQALALAARAQADTRAWLATRANLGHALRRQGRTRESLAQFDEVLRRGGRDANVLAARGLVLLEVGDGPGAAVALHEALAVAPQDPVATDLLTRALEVCEDEPIMNVLEEDYTRRIDEVARTVERTGRRAARGVPADEERMALDDGDDEGDV